MYIVHVLARVYWTRASTCVLDTCQHVYKIHMLARVRYTRASTCTICTCQHVCICTCAPTIGKDAPWDVLLEEASIKKIARRITQSVTTVGSRTRPPHFLINSRNFCMLELSLTVWAKISWFLSRAKPYVGSHVWEMGHLLVQLAQVPGSSYAHSGNKPVNIHTFLHKLPLLLLLGRLLFIVC